MPFFMGEFTYALDDKGRVKVPAGFRHDLVPSDDAMVVLVRDREDCVAVYTPAEYQKLRSKLLQMDLSDPANRILVRRQVSSAFECNVDPHGRIKVPAELVKYAKLEKGGKVKIAGFMHYVQIWNPEDYQRSMEALGEDHS
jgi:MraZ protein